MTAPIEAQKPDIAIEFMKRFFAGTQHDIELRAIDAATKSVNRLFSRKPAAIREFLKENATRDLYFGVATREGGGTASHCRELPALFVDIDSLDKDAILRVECFVPTPSLVICSGGGLHCYWLMKTPLDVQDAQTVQLLACVCKAIGGDPTCTDVARVLRIPGTTNFKAKYTTPRGVYIVKDDWE